MQGVLLTPLAILPELEAVRVVLLVLLGRIVAALALSAGQSDQSTHEYSLNRILSSIESTHESLKSRWSPFLGSTLSSQVIETI